MWKFEHAWLGPGHEEHKPVWLHASVNVTPLYCGKDSFLQGSGYTQHCVQTNSLLETVKPMKLALIKKFNSAKIWSVMVFVYESGNKLKLAYWHCKKCYSECIFMFEIPGKVEGIWWTDEAYYLLKVFFFHFFFFNLITRSILGR